MSVAMIGPKFYAWDRNGKPLAFGKLYTYQARTNDPKETYQSEDQIVPNTNPVILNGEGYANVYLSGSYKMVLKDENDNEIWSTDPVSSAEPSEWVVCLTATYLSPTTLKVNGNFTSQYEVGRRVRVDNNTANYSYSTVKSVVFAGAETTIELVDPVVTTGVREICASIVTPDSQQPIDDVVRSKTLTEAVEDGLAKEGELVIIEDRDYGLFKYESGQTNNTFNIIECVGVSGLSLVLKPQESANVKQFGATGAGGNTDDYGAIQACLNYAVENKMPMYVPSPSVSYAIGSRINLDSFKGTADLNIKIYGDGFSSNYIDTASNSVFTHVDGYTSYVFDLSVSNAPGTTWFTLHMEDLNMWGKNLNIGMGMRVIGCHYFINNVGMNELDLGFRPEQCFRGMVINSSIARNNVNVQFAGYNSATSFVGNTLRQANDACFEFVEGYPGTYGNNNTLDNVNFNENNLESSQLIFDFRFGDTSHIRAKGNYTESYSPGTPNPVLFDCSNGSFNHTDHHFNGMSRRLQVKYNKCRDILLEGESITLEEFSNTNTVNLIIKNTDNLRVQSEAETYLVPGNVTEYTLNEDPDFSLHSIVTTPVLLPRSWKGSSTAPTYSWVEDTPYGYDKKVLKYDGSGSGALSSISQLKKTKDNHDYVHGFVSVKVESGSCRIGFQIDGGGVNYLTPLTVNSNYQMQTLRLPNVAGASELRLLLDSNGSPGVFYVDCVVLGYSLHPEFKQSESIVSEVTVPTGSGLTLTSDQELLVQATPAGSSVNMGVNGNDSTSPDIVHNGGGDVEAVITVTPRSVNQRYRVN